MGEVMEVMEVTEVTAVTEATERRNQVMVVTEDTERRNQVMVDTVTKKRSKKKMRKKPKPKISTRGLLRSISLVILSNPLESSSLLVSFSGSHKGKSSIQSAPSCSLLSCSSPQPRLSSSA